MELRHLRYFAAVVEAGSLTAAAQALHMSQPPLSVAIAKLEAEVGVPLLVRTPRGVEPTSAGRYLLDQSSRVLGDVDDMVAALGRFGAGTAGQLTMAAVPALLWHRIPRLLRAHAEVAPEVEIRLVDPPPWTAIDMLQQRKADLAAIMVADPDRFARRHRGVLDVVDWGDVPLVAALPPGQDDAPDPLPLASFDGATVVMPRGTAAVPSLPEAVTAAFRRHGVAPARVRTVETIQTSVPLVEAGIARAILPDPDHASLARFGMTLRRIVPEPRPLRALVLTRAGAGKDPALGRLLRQVAEDAPRDPM
ncbi:LysR family transcriptional regulator [Demequina sp. SYSU T00192]|uniref:LysR family transcriptional regulator n=1 Tax=Demequina litoralis TaxID=3051660 RepID=A0ABT8GAZ4_9MICO|nr:LysR family transcriptional regulator [Demequina sp. SYSU T00192]MDN4476301.1 LysR family transcriptional regulator [Demequina sp. SYSU T00192]